MGSQFCDPGLGVFCIMGGGDFRNLVHLIIEQATCTCTLECENWDGYNFKALIKLVY